MHKRLKNFSLPLHLTLFRLAVAPLLSMALLLWFFPGATGEHRVGLAVFTMFCSLTDFFDGFLARKWKQKTVLGELLDPLADKFFICSLVLSLLWLHKVNILWSLIILGRELWVTSMREIAVTRGFSLPVSQLGKTKTMIQMSCIIWIIAYPDYIFSTNFVYIVEQLLVWTSAAITLYSGYDYFATFVRKLA